MAMVVLLGGLASCTVATSDRGASTTTESAQAVQPDGATDAAAPADEGAVTAAAPIPSTSASSTVWLADLTSPEVADRLAQGATTIIVPTGGIEQNGPHMTLDKHQLIVAYTAERIAQQAGSALVAPVMAYVPEGDPTLMDNHLQWPGTISVTEPVFAQVLESVATSLANQGFTTIAFLGDSGSSQSVQSQVALDLSNRWAAQGTKVINLDAYYNAGNDPSPATNAGVPPEEVGTHAAVLDTSQVLAVAPDAVRTGQMAPSGSASGLTASGFDGNPTKASAAIGQAVLDAKVAAGVEQLVNSR